MRRRARQGQGRARRPGAGRNGAWVYLRTRHEAGITASASLPFNSLRQRESGRAPPALSFSLRAALISRGKPDSRSPGVVVERSAIARRAVVPRAVVVAHVDGIVAKILVSLCGRVTIVAADVAGVVAHVPAFP